MNQHIYTAAPRSMRRVIARVFVAGLVVALAACGDSPLGPGEHGATMQVTASAVTATTLGQSLAIDAALLNSSGKAMRSSEIHWELSAPGVLEDIGGGRFRVLHEGTVQVAAVWPKDPSVRAAVTVTVNASILASACVARSDQALSGAPRKCAQQRVVVNTAPTLASLNKTSSTSHSVGRQP